MDCVCVIMNVVGVEVNVFNRGFLGFVIIFILYVNLEFELMFCIWI